MDLVAEMLVTELQRVSPEAVSVTAVVPKFSRRIERLPLSRWRGAARNADRLLNRFWDYPNYVRTLMGQHDLFHVADHSYAQLVHALPAGRTGVFCHDLDTFRCLLEPAQDPRPRWFRAMAGRILQGMQKASVVFYTTGPVREQILRHGLLDTRRLVHAPLGISHEFTADALSPGTNFGPGLDHFPAALGPGLAGQSFLLHVGSCIPRKRVNVLLDVFAAVRRGRPGLRLVQVGGEWTAAHRDQLAGLGLGPGDVVQVRGLTRHQIAALYRAAAAVLQPSEAEGFGLPVVEALACGAAVVASDIPVLREVGGPAAVYCPVADVPAWAAAVGRVLDDAPTVPPRDQRLHWASKYSWAEHARTIADAYLNLCGQ